LGAGELAKQLGINWRAHQVLDSNQLIGKQGIIYFENYHIDLWDKYNMVGNSRSFYGNKKVYFMELQ
jgi:hypothetical protein